MRWVWTAVQLDYQLNIALCSKNATRPPTCCYNAPGLAAQDVRQELMAVVTSCRESGQFRAQRGFSPSSTQDTATGGNTSKLGESLAEEV